VALNECETLFADFQQAKVNLENATNVLISLFGYLHLFMPFQVSIDMQVIR
jgi:hypothetical protein